MRPFVLAAALLLALGAGAVRAQAVTDVSRDKFRDMTMPFDDKLVAHFFGPAPAPGGESVTFEAHGPVLFYVHRDAPAIAQGAVVTIIARNAAGSSVLAWTGEGIAAGAPMLKRVELPPGTQSVTLKVVDKAEGGPTRSRPYTVIAEAWPLSPAASIRSSGPAPGPSPGSAEALAAAAAAIAAAQAVRGCELADRPDRRPEYMELSHRFSLDRLPANVLVPKVITAGGYLFVSTSSPLPRGSRLQLRFWAKPSGDGPYREVCDKTLSAENLQRGLVVTQGGVDQYAAWRVEMKLVGPSAMPSGFELQVQREKLLVSPDPFRAEPWNNARALICFDRVVNRLAVAPSTNRFAGRTRLNIRIDDRTLSQAQVMAVEDAVLKAAALWVHSCVLCKPDNMALISVNGKLLVHPGLFQLVVPRGGPPPPGVNLPPPDPKRMDDLLASFIGSARVGIGAPFLPYRELPGAPHQVFQRLCEVPGSESQTPTLKHVQEAVCTESPGAGTMANIRLIFRADGNTSCGTDPDIIGCRADHELTEYNAKDYRFVAGAVAIGSGPSELELLQVILHEMGHWIGLEHIDGGESIMSASLEKARCIDFETVKAVAEQIAVTEGRTRRVTPSAFRLRGQVGR